MSSPARSVTTPAYGWYTATIKGSPERLGSTRYRCIMQFHDDEVTRKYGEKVFTIVDCDNFDVLLHSSRLEVYARENMYGSMFCSAVKAS